MKASLNSEISLTHLKLLTGNFCDNDQPYKLFRSQYSRYDGSLFLFLVLYSFMYLLLVLVYRWVAWHNRPLIPFSTIKNMLIWVKRSNFTLLFFKGTYYANLGAIRKQIWSTWYISRHISRKFSNTSAITYAFEHINHDIPLGCLF